VTWPPIELRCVRGAAPAESMVRQLARSLEQHLQTPVTLGPDLPLPETADPPSQRVSSNTVVDYLIDLAGPHPERFRSWTVALTSLDLFAPQRDFVFGEAALGGAWAVVSSARLQPPATSDDLAHQRLLKEILHELGHLADLSHCTRPDCVMHPSTSLQDIDLKTTHLCPACQRRERLPTFS
jgi:predicted Zn-dependent protease